MSAPIVPVRSPAALAAEVIPTSITRQLGTAMAPPDFAGMTIQRRWGIIVAKDDTKFTVDVQIDGIVIPGVKRVATYIAVVGDKVRLDINGTEMVVAGALATSENDLTKIPPAIVANTQSISAVNTVVTGQGVDIKAVKDKVNAPTVPFDTQLVYANQMTAKDYVYAQGTVYGAELDVTGGSGYADHFQSDTMGCNTLGVGTVNAATVGGQIRDFQGDWTVARLYAARTRTGDAEEPVNGRYTGREMTLEGNCLVKGNLYVRGAINPPSESRLKNHIEDVTNGLEVIDALKPVIYTWRDTEFRDELRHVGIYVDELAEVAPDAVLERGEADDVPTENPDVAAAASDGRTYEDRAVMAYLVSAVQILHKDNIELRARIDALTSSEDSDG